MIYISLSVVFNDVELSQWITVTTGFTRGSRGPKEILTANSGNSNGSFLQGSRFVEKTISMPFILLQPTLQERRKLAAALNVDEPKRLIFGDEPDKYYMAMPSDSIDFEEFAKHDDGTIEWLCLDPFAYAIDQKSIDAVGDTISINNAGTMPTPVSFEITNHGDNGFVGLAGADGIIQVGNPQEQDGENKTEQSVVLSHSFNSDAELAGWEMNTHKPAYTYGNTLGGTFATHSGLHGDKSVYVSDFKNGTVKTMWYGASMYKGFTPSANFDLTTLIQTVKNGNSLGVSEVNIYDSAGVPLCGYRFRQISVGGQMQLFFYVRDKIVMEWTGNTNGFLKNFWGNINITKEGPNFTFRVINLDNKVKGTYHYYDNSLATTTGVGAGFWVARSQGTQAFKCELLMIHVNVSLTGFNNLKNVFAEGDDIKINITDTTVKTSLNDMPRIDLQDIGTQPIMAPVGKSEIKIVSSSFSSAPDVTARFRERWI